MGRPWSSGCAACSLLPCGTSGGDGSSWRAVGQGATDADGRLRAGAAPQPGLYRLRFETRSRSAFFPEVSIVFEVSDSKADYHVPLLISPFGYSTYRGS